MRQHPSAGFTPFRWAVIAGAALLAACAYTPTVPEVADGPSAAQVRVNVDAHIGSRVRWGGTVVMVENRREDTWVAILSRPLDARGRPVSNGRPGERFIAVLPGFAEPALYPPGQRITIVGTVVGSATRTVGEFPYTYPLVAVETRQLWETPTPRRDPLYYDPYWHDSYRYDPWYRDRYPWRPRRYWR